MSEYLTARALKRSDEFSGHLSDYLTAAEWGALTRFAKADFRDNGVRRSRNLRVALAKIGHALRVPEKESPDAR